MYVKKRIFKYKISITSLKYYYLMFIGKITKVLFKTFYEQLPNYQIKFR